MLSNNDLCNICKVNKSDYRCPKCDCKYCSLKCYKSHNNYCTEQFSKEQVIESLKSIKVSDEQKEAILEIVRRNKESLEEDEYKMFTEDEEMENLLYKLESMNLTDEEAQNLLPKNMMREFYRFVHSKDIIRYLKPWVPWWKSDHIKPKIEVIKEESKSDDEDEYDVDNYRLDNEEGFSKKIDKPDTPPSILEDIPPLSALTKVTPSPQIIYSLVDISYVYVYLKRLYNGDLETDIEECIKNIFTLSQTLGNNVVYKNTYEALDACVKRSMMPDFNVSLDMSISIVGDMVEIFSKGRLFVLALLSDMHNVFASGEIVIKKSKKIKMARRKLLFFVAWANEVNDKSFKNLAEEIVNCIKLLRNET